MKHQSEALPKQYRLSIFALGFAQLKELESKVLSSSDNSLFRCSECDYVHRRRIQVIYPKAFLSEYLKLIRQIYHRHFLWLRDTLPILVHSTISVAFLFGYHMKQFSVFSDGRSFLYIKILSCKHTHYFNNILYQNSYFLNWEIAFRCWATSNLSTFPTATTASSVHTFCRPLGPYENTYTETIATRKSPRMSTCQT